MNPKRFNTAEFLKTNKSKAFGFGLFTFIVIITLILGAIIPSVSAMVRLQSEISTKRILSEKLKDKIDALSNLSQEYDKYDYIFRDLPLIYPSNRDYSLILGYINDISNDYGYNLSSLSFPEDNSLVGSSAFKVIRPQLVTITITGSQAYLIDYLGELENLPMKPKVVRVNFNNSTNKDGNISYNIQLEVYLVENNLFYK